MKKISKSSLNIYEVIDTALEISRNLPLLLFLVIPYLYDNVNGYSIVLCLPLACLLFFLSSNCWLEIKSRYIVQNEPYLNTKSINRLLENPLENDVEKYAIFRIFDSVMGLNLAVILSLADSLNALTIHCLVLKWFYEIIFSHLFYHQSLPSSLCNANESNQTTTDFHNSTSSIPVKPITILIEVLTNLGYFILVKLLSSGDYFVYIRQFMESISKWEEARLKSINQIIYYTFFYVITILIFYLSISASSFKLVIDCEHFFKNLTSHSYLLGVAILMCTYYTLLIEYFSKIRNKKSKSRPVPTTRSNYLLNELEKYLNLMIKIISVCVIASLFVILLTTFNRYRNRCCFGFYESVLQATSDLAHVTKQIFLFIVCFFVFSASNGRLQSSIANSIELADRLFGSQSNLAKNTAAETTSMISTESGIDLSGSTRTLIIRPSQKSSSFLRLKLLEKLTLADIVLILYALVTLIQLPSLTLSNMIQLWTTSFLFVNLIVITVAVLINYFPYQVLVDEKQREQQSQTTIGFLIAKQKPVRPTPRLILKQQPIRSETNDEASMIDSVFTEHKQHLRSQALSDRSLSFGVDQPSMRSAYRASIGYTGFCIGSILITIGFRIIVSSSDSSLSFKTILVLITFTLLLLSFIAVSVYFYMLKSNRETIYRKNLFYKMLFLPYVQLTIVFFTLFVLLASVSLFSLNFFLTEMFVLVIALAVTNRIVYVRRLKKMSPKAAANERWENAVGEPLEMNVFTIGESTYNDDDDDDDDGDNVFDVKINDQEETTVKKVDGQLDIQRSSSLNKIGSEASNINLLI